MLYQGADYSGIVDARMSPLPHQYSDAVVSSVQPAYDVTLSQEAMKARLLAATEEKVNPAQTAFQEEQELGDSSRELEALVSKTQNTPYNVMRATQAYDAFANGR
jgi:hypothetical protein